MTPVSIGADIIRQACRKSPAIRDVGWDRPPQIGTLTTRGIMTCLGVTETVRFGIQTRSVQDNLSDLLRVGFLLRSLRGQDLVTIYQIWTHNEGMV